jgi:hypothetical protein
MVIRCIATGEDHEAVISKLAVKDFAAVKKDKKRFDKFDWSKCKGKEVYKLQRKGDDTILGLICLQEHADPSVNAMEIELLEVSEENIGHKKAWDLIGGCLIAYACRESFKRGHDGCVFLIPKTGLIDWYQDHYGFTYEPVRTTQRPDGFMVIYNGASHQLIKKYLKR